MSLKENISFILLNDHLRKLRQGHMVNNTKLARSWASMRIQVVWLSPSDLSIFPWCQHDASPLSLQRTREQAMGCRRENTQRFGALASIWTHLLSPVFSLPSCTYHPTHRGFMCSLAACPPPNEELTHNSRNLPGNWQLHSKERAESLFPSSKDGMNK